MYSVCPTKVKNQTQDSGWFNINMGVRQGDVLSPLLFISFVDKCMRNIGVGDPGEETMVFADYMAIVANNMEQLQRVANRWHEEVSQNEMKISTGSGKTEFMFVAREDCEQELIIGENQINQVEKYKYLGVHLNKRNKQEGEVNMRINKYNNTMTMLYQLLKQRDIPRQRKTAIYIMILRPILTYGCETWALTAKTESRIQAAEMRVLRLIRGVSRRDRVRNVKIREDLGVTPLLQFIEKRRLQWFGHVKRMPEDRHPKKYLTWRPMGMRPLGWEDLGRDEWVVLKRT